MHPTNEPEPGQDPTEKLDEAYRQILAWRDGGALEGPEEYRNLAVGYFERKLPALLAEMERLRAERDRLIDSHITAGGPFSRDRFVAFRDELAEAGFDTKEEAVAFVRKFLLDE